MPESVLPIFVDLTLQNPADKSRLDAAINALQRDFDPCCSITLAADAQTVSIHSLSDDYLDFFVGVIRDEFSIPINVSAPQIVYRETITRRAFITYRHKQGTEPAFAELSMLFDPLKRGAGALFKDMTARGILPPAYVTAIAEGLAAAKECGHFSGYPCVDFMATLAYGTYSADASAELFTAAARVAFRQGMCQAQPVLLEPIMKCEVMTPEDFLGDVIGVLNSRRGMMQSIDVKNDKSCVVASVPLATMFGFSVKLRSITRGRAHYFMEYSHYDRVPASGKPTQPDDRFPPAIGMRQMPYKFTNLDGNSRNRR